MKPHISFLIAALFLGGCNVVAWGNLMLLAITLALFCATLSLGRHVSAEERSESAEQETLR